VAKHAIPSDTLHHRASAGNGKSAAKVPGQPAAASRLLGKGDMLQRHRWQEFYLTSESMGKSMNDNRCDRAMITPIVFSRSGRFFHIYPSS
jgi:hypothetical protein